MSCPDLLILSQLLDGELADPGPASSHVGACPACADRLGRLRGAERALRRASGGEAIATPYRTDACLAPGEIVTWLDPTTTADDRRAASRHLDACDHCLGEALAAARMASRMSRGPSLPVPTVLAARVAGAWTAATPAPALSEVVVALTRRGVRLIEHHLVAPMRDLVEVAQLAPAMRASADVAILQFDLRAEGNRIRTTVIPAGEAVDVTIALADAAGDPLPSRRISLVRRGRAVFSARTDAAGQLALPSLERGVYEVSCPEIAAMFRLDLRESP